MEHTFYRRLLSAVCAIALAFTAVCPAVAAAPEETTGTPQLLTVFRPSRFFMALLYQILPQNTIIP